MRPRRDWEFTPRVSIRDASVAITAAIHSVIIYKVAGRANWNTVEGNFERIDPKIGVGNSEDGRDVVVERKCNVARRDDGKGSPRSDQRSTRDVRGCDRRRRISAPNLLPVKGLSNLQNIPPKC